MKHIIKRMWNSDNIGLALLFLLIMLGLWTFLLVGPNFSASQAYNETYIVNTTVNITNAAPLITAISLDTPVNLLSYNTTTVFCNVSVYDYDNDTLVVNATLFLEGVVGPDDNDDGNNHYSNTSCSPITPQDENMDYICAFEVQYYADNSSDWICNATVDDGGLVPTNNISNYAIINPLVAIKMDPLLDYGDLEVGETSPDRTANVTNAGNRDANISVEGWGDTPGDGYAFVCDFGHIDLSYERYNTTGGSGYPDMYQLTGATSMIPDFYVPQRTSESQDSISPTYWQVQIPVGAGGVCNGKILFSATDRGN